MRKEYTCKSYFQSFVFQVCLLLLFHIVFFVFCCISGFEESGIIWAAIFIGLDGSFLYIGIYNRCLLTYSIIFATEIKSYLFGKEQSCIHLTAPIYVMVFEESLGFFKKAHKYILLSNRPIGHCYYEIQRDKKHSLLRRYDLNCCIVLPYDPQLIQVLPSPVIKNH